jgi:uncharacterized membrane protein
VVDTAEADDRRIRAGSVIRRHAAWVIRRRVNRNHASRVTTNHAVVTDRGAMNTTIPTTTTYNVLAVSFDEDLNAYAALTKLKELDGQGQVALDEAAVIERGRDGTITVKDRVESPQLVGTAGGGLTGLLVGVLGGPLGVLLGGSTGMLIGSLFDLDEADQIDTALGEIAKSVEAGHTAVIAVVTEPSAEIVDAAMRVFGGSVTRRGVADVEAELAAVEEAQRKAAHEAQQELMRGRRDHAREAAHAKVEALKAKLGGHDSEAVEATPAA